LSNFLTTVILHSLFTFPNCSLFTFIAIMNDRWICESDRWLRNFTGHKKITL
jgi:hypothetical protein